MKSNILKIFTAVMIVISVFSCNSNTEKKVETKTERVRNVKISEISEQTISREIDYPANLIANEEVYLAPATPGRILRINAQIGDRVAAGKLLIEMDPTQLNTTQVQLMNLEKDMQRLDTLIQYGGVSQQQYDQMKTQVAITRENVELLRTNINMKAPFSGTITGKYFENGELYSGAPNTQAAKAAVVVLQQTNLIKAVIAVQEKYYPKIKLGMKVKLYCEIFPDKDFEGTISLIYPTINAQTKTFNVEIKVPNGNENLKPGMYARININLGEEKAIIVPASAVLQQIGTNLRYVMIYDNGVAHKVIVETGKRFEDKVEIFSENIKLGDKLITTGHSSLEEGFIISVVE